MSKQPRTNIEIWVGPLTTQPPQPDGGGQLMSKIGTFIWNNDDAGLQAYVVANKVELGNVTGNYIQGLRDAGYIVNDDGTVTPGNTPPIDVTTINATWGLLERYLTADFGAFKCNAFAVKFTVPVDATNDGKSRKISVSESNGPPTLRHMVLSTIPGDFGPGIAQQYGTQTTIDLGVGGSGAMGLIPSQTYYMNFRNYSPDVGGCTCSVDSCNASVDVVW